MGSGHSSQRYKSHPNVSSIQRKASISTSSSAHDKIATTKDGMSRTASGSDINEKNYSIFFPIDRLAKLLHHKTQAEFGVNGIVQEVFVRCVFPQYPDLGNRFFLRMHKTAKAKTKYLGVTAFRQQCELYLSVLDDALIHEHYVKMFILNGSNAGTSSGGGSDTSKEKISEDDVLLMNMDGLSDLLLTSFRIAIANYVISSGSNSDYNSCLPTETYCPYINRTISSVTHSCFFGKDTLSVGFVCRWLEKNIPNLIQPLHRFCVHTLTTVYRSIESDVLRESKHAGLNLALAEHANAEKAQTDSDDRLKPSASESISTAFKNAHIDTDSMPLSQAWLLAAALPVVYTRPQPSTAQRAQAEKAEPPETPTVALPFAPTLETTNASNPHLISTIPTHWSLLYDSQQHGVGSNRFLHHVIGYKGPTLIILHSTASNEVFCIAAPSEWRETHLYTGGDDCHVIQLLPKFSILQKGPKLLYLNTCVRGYPKGLRAGSDPRKPILTIDEHFEKIEYRGVSSILFSIEVYGCGDKQIRDIQLDIKKWQVREAERQRTVKLTSADWIDHPDRYLLELGGRPQYNNS